MTFYQWLDTPISGTTRRAYYSDNQLTAARDAWEAATAAEQWMDIATAPKDGTPILLGYFLDDGGGGDPEVARWLSIHKTWVSRTSILNSQGYFSPTHWMPLPAPPSTTGDS